MNEIRRRLMEAGAALGAAALLGTPDHASSEVDDLVSVPPRPAARTPGRTGDFDFLAGDWRIQHRRRPTATADWDRFEGEASCWTILGGAGSVEELRIPARDFSGLGLRLLDSASRTWSDHWVNAKSGRIATPGTPGSFEHGVGLFFTDERDEQGPFVVAGIWDRITADACRWRQLVSRDEGRTWQPDWVMNWRRR